jgi:hypothetical protein
MLYATAPDVAEAYEGDLPDAWSARVDYLVRTTNARLTAMIPALPGWVNGGQVDADLAAAAVVNAVLRQLRNPEGSVTRSQSVDGFTISTSYDRGVARNAGVFDPADLALLHPAAARSGPIRMRPWSSLDHRHHYGR